MASFTVQTSQTFPDGTVVGAYPRTAWLQVGPPTGAPSGAAVATATVTGGQAVFAGLADNTHYVAYAASPDRYLSFRTPPPSAASGIGAAQLVKPSGDLTGAADAAAINAALATQDVALSGTYTINASIVLQPNRTLLLAGATVKLANAANVPILDHANKTVGGSTDTNLAVVGLGNRFMNVLDGNGFNQTRSATFSANSWKSCLAIFVGVAGIQLENFTVKDPVAWGISPQSGCSKLRLRNIESTFSATGLLTSSPIQVYGACSDFRLDGLYGKSEDDGIAFLNYSSLAAGGGVPYVYAPGATTTTLPGGQVSNVSLTNIAGQFATTAGTAVRFLNDAGNTITNVRVHNVDQQVVARPAITFGPSQYVTTPPGISDTANFEITNVSTVGQTAIDFSQSTRDVSIDGVQMNGNASFIATALSPPTPTTFLTNITIANVLSTSVQVGQRGVLMQFPANYTINGFTIDGFRAPQWQTLLNNTGPNNTGVHLRRVRVGTMYGNAFTSSPAELTGSVDDVQILSRNGLTTTWGGSPMRLKIGQNMPVLTSGDVTPVPVVRGSTLTADKTKDPTGGANASHARWICDGANWIKATDLGTTVGPLDVAGMLWWFDANQISAANGSSIAALQDLSGSGRAPAQATSTKQPTLATGLATLNSKAAVRFDGVDDFLQSPSFTTINQPFTLFFVVVWRSLPGAGGYVFDGISTSATTRAALFKGATQMTAFAGSSLVTSTPAANTAYLYSVVYNGASTSMYTNSTGTPVTGAAGGNGVSGITLGTDRTGATPGPIDLAECLAYSGVLAAGDFAAVQSYLASKYAITLGA